MKNIAKIITDDGVILRIDCYKVSRGEFVDCREHRNTVPTKNGFSVPLAAMPKFIEALEKALADSRGV